MNLADPIKLVSQLVDLPIIDKDERWCGVVDDVELQGSAGKEMRIKALLAGPGAYKGRLPGWMFWVVRRIVGDRIVRVPADQVIEIGSVVKLKCEADDLRLGAQDRKLRPWIPHWGAM